MPSVTHFAVQGILPPSQITHTSPPVFTFIKTFGYKNKTQHTQTEICVSIPSLLWTCCHSDVDMLS